MNNSPKANAREILRITTLTLSILLITPPVGLAIVFMLLISSPRAMRWIRSVVVSVRRATRSCSRQINSHFKDKFTRPAVLARILILLVVEFTSLYLLIYHLQIKETDDYLWYAYRQIALTGALLFSVLGMAWIIFSFAAVFESLFAKVAISLVISACILFCRLLAIDFLSGHFPFPPAYIPVAFSMAVIIMAFSFFSIILGILAFVFELSMFVTIGMDFKKHPYAAWALMIFAFAFLGAYASVFATMQGIQTKGQLLIIKLAEKYDFTTNHLCTIEEGEKVLFIENMADRAFAATFPSFKKIPTRVTDKELDRYMPQKFRMVRCNYLPGSENGRR